MIIHIKNFGKIDSADIDLSSLVIFVGENNSGKTYVMQLIYGLIDLLRDIRTHIFLVSNNPGLFVDWDGKKGFSVSLDDAGFINLLQQAVNSYIEQNKNEIIERVFHTKELTVESLWVEITALQDIISLICEPDDMDNADEDYSKNLFRLDLNGNELYSVRFLEGIQRDRADEILKRDIVSLVLSKILGLTHYVDPRRRDDKPIVYLPASRSGIMLLYANYLSSEATDNSFDGVEIDSGNNTVSENKYGVTQPVYDFLMLLLKHKTSGMIDETTQNLISFINTHIINGRLEQIGNTVRYTPGEAERSLPIYLSSSLVSELAPLYQILSGIQRFTYILYDEIETCQHPTKQLQLARLLIRMVNSGYRLIVSTHSDTMAAAINNLITLSFKENRDTLTKELEYEPDDILKTDHVSAYKFLIDNNGRTTVKDVPGHFSIGVGFDFDLFNSTNDKIYDDAVVLAEVD